MIFKRLIFSLFAASFGSVNANPPNALPAAKNSLVFVSNAGQIVNQHQQPRADIDFRIGGSGVNLFVGSAALQYQWAKPIGTKVVEQDTLQEIATYRNQMQWGKSPFLNIVLRIPD